MHCHIVEAIRSYAWATQSNYTGAGVPTMLSGTELTMLEWLARTLPLEGRSIVDAGAFLGGSTAALASGLVRNEQASGARIHSYDMFVVPNDQYSRHVIGKGRPVGSSVLDLFEANLGQNRNLVDVHTGDFLTAEPPDGEIGLLFVDIAKTYELNERIVQSYFKRLVPEISIVIQQDHNDHSCPWVNMTMEYYSDYFDFLVDDSASRLFLYSRPIPPEKLNVDFRKIAVPERFRLVLASAARAQHPVPWFQCVCSAAWIIYEDLGADAALRYLEKIDADQPWQSSESYAKMVASSITWMSKIGGHDRFAEKYFSPTGYS